MTAPVNFVTIESPENGTLYHTVSPTSGTVVTGSTFTPTEGRLLVCVASGAVTLTTPTDWTLPTNGSAINYCGLYVWHREAASGSNQFTTTANGSDYAAVFTFMEFYAGSTFGTSASATAVRRDETYPVLSGLTGTNQVYYAGGRAWHVAEEQVGAWASGVELVDKCVLRDTNDGIIFGLAWSENYTGSSASSTWVISPSGMDHQEKLTFCLTAAEPPTTIDASELWHSDGEDFTQMESRKILYSNGSTWSQHYLYVSNGTDWTRVT